MSRPRRHAITLLPKCVAIGAAAVALSGCNMLNRLAEVGEEPPLTQIQNPTHAPNYHPVSLPMPQVANTDPREPNSLWRQGARAFFKDQRAAKVGDILTVDISISDKAQLNNTTTRSRANTDSAALGAFLGYESSLNQVLPEAVDNSNLLNLDSSTSNSGSGSIDRDETIELKIAAVVTQKLPNGNLVLAGRQEVRVNYEVRQLQVTGVVRPEDIKADNTISYEKIAEARISYGGKGHISDFQQPRYGSQILDAIFPF